MPFGGRTICGFPSSAQMSRSEGATDSRLANLESERARTLRTGPSAAKETSLSTACEKSSCENSSVAW